MPAYTYYTVMQQSQDKKYWRLLLVTYAVKHGIRAAARHFRAAPNTVRRWLRRWDGTPESLADRSRRPHYSPQKLSAEAEEEILAARRRLPTCGARRLKLLFTLPYAASSITRVLRDHGLLRQYRKKKHRRRRLLWEVKKRYRFFQYLQVDTKYLTDLPLY